MRPMCRYRSGASCQSLTTQIQCYYCPQLFRYSSTCNVQPPTCTAIFLLTENVQCKLTTKWDRLSNAATTTLSVSFSHRNDSILAAMNAPKIYISLKVLSSMAGLEHRCRRSTQIGRSLRKSGSLVVDLARNMSNDGKRFMRMWTFLCTWVAFCHSHQLCQNYHLIAIIAKVTLRLGQITPHFPPKHHQFSSGTHFSCLAHR